MAGWKITSQRALLGFTLLTVTVLTSALVPAAGQARTSGAAISIDAQTSHKPVGRLVYTPYGTAATITGAVADGQTGTAVELQGSTFPFHAGYTTLAQTVTGDGGSYSFTAKPTLATRYRVVLASDPTSQSTVVTVYVVERSTNRPSRPCGGGFRCQKHFSADVVYPAGVAKREGAKKVYYYFGIRYGSRTTPPSRVRLVGTGRQHHRGGSRYRLGFSVSFSTMADYYYYWETCTKDTEARDGYGLPGHHHCGARSITYKAIQNGWIG
jgi:hypothetical protein